jgi:hypothetical protein
MKATIPSVSVAKAGVGHLAVGKVAIGPITVGQLILRNAALGISAGQAQLHGVRVTVSLHFDVIWHVHVGLPWPLPDIDIGGTDSLGTASIPFGFGDAEIPSLHNINLTIPQMTGANVHTTADPITNLRLDNVAADDIQAAGVTAPVAGFTLSGFGLSTLAIDGAGIPAASVATAKIGHVHGDPLALGALTLRGLTLPNAAASNISSAALDIPVTRPPFELGPLPLGLLTVGVRITPSALMHVDRMELSGVQANASVGAIELHDVTLPYDALNITLSDIGIQTLTIPTIGVASP